MGFLSEWITNIVLFILIAVIVELFLPRTNFERYVKTAVGMLLILLFLQPLFSFLKKDVADLFSEIPDEEYINEATIENLIENKKVEIEQRQRAYISKQVAVQMKRQVEDDLEDLYSVRLLDVDISFYDENLAKNGNDVIGEICVTVQEASDDGSMQNSSVELIPAISIEIRKDVRNHHEKKENELKQYLAHVWQVPETKISFIWVGEESER